MNRWNDGLRACPGFAPAGLGQLLCGAAALLFLTAACGSALAAPQINAAAPALVVSERGGQSFDLSKLRGKVVLVTYWATWCAPCKKEMPILDSFYRRYHEQGLEVIGISADRPQDFAKMRKISGALAYPTATLNQISDNGFGPPEGFPLTYVVDREGIIRDKFIDVRERLLRDVVLPLLPNN
jgi:cytochrome c biogenesis protein CcmG/thiol:disulfide interchange protein DsbE